MLAANATIKRVDKRGSRHYIVEGDYRVEGVELPSVTTILGVIAKPALIPWARNVALDKAKATLLESTWPQSSQEWSQWVEEVITEARRRPDEIRDSAADKGTRAHELICRIIEGGKVEVPEDLKPHIEAFWAWYDKAGLEIRFGETMVYHPVYHYAGGMDATAWRGKQLVVLDWKTGGVWPEAAMQVAAYAKSWEAMTGERVEEGWVVGLKDGFTAKRVKDIETAFSAFLAALNIWRHMRRSAWDEA